MKDLSFNKFRKVLAASVRRDERGLSLVESLVAIVILAIVGLSITYNTVASYRMTHRNIRHSVAAQLALERIEELAARDPLTITTNDNETENLLQVGNMEFLRTTRVTVNSDNSRTVSVDVIPADESLGGTASLANTFALWGSL